ncbi:MAG: hypothetical protein P0Y65_05935 [Candidatus Devosia phytovorans]|uniref:Uncharacterized protein n=1 Tax=Candidatus Devosia phytovorans TaxID=3121372 RepID=A0AAJ6B0J0_9HYPH|nr:hypothetical protein [Devosia sp.]WEK05795.1 MAG: hypothetical protein P0Y65_05935 [Devosia sp.]
MFNGSCTPFRRSPGFGQGPHERHFTDSMRCDHCRWRGVYLWVEPAEQKRQILQKSGPDKSSNYQVRDWGQSYPYNASVIIATADNLFVARGAYIAAAGFYFDHRITLQQGAFVMGDTKRDGLPNVMTHEDFKRMREIESGTLSLEELEVFGPTISAKAS